MGCFSGNFLFHRKGNGYEEKRNEHYGAGGGSVDGTGRMPEYRADYREPDCTEPDCRKYSRRSGTAARGRKGQCGSRDDG